MFIDYIVKEHDISDILSKSFITKEEIERKIKLIPTQNTYHTGAFSFVPGFFTQICFTGSNIFWAFGYIVDTTTSLASMKQNLNCQCHTTA